MDRGRLLAIGTLEELSRSLWGGFQVEVDFLEPPAVPVADALRLLPDVTDVRSEPLRLTVRVTGEATIPAVVEALVRQGARILRVSPRQPSLEEIYFEIRKEAQP